MTAHWRGAPRTMPRTTSPSPCKDIVKGGDKIMIDMTVDRILPFKATCRHPPLHDAG
jgi:hypothetical protein